MKRLTYAAAIALIFAASTQNVQAETKANLGLQGGFTEDPDALFFGGHGQFQLPVSAFILLLEPGIALGIGEFDDDDFFTLQFWGYFKFYFDISGELYLYPMIGPTVHYINFGDDRFRDDDDFEPGLAIGGGIDFANFFFQFHLTAAADYPDFTLTFGYTFR